MFKLFKITASTGLEYYVISESFDKAKEIVAQHAYGIDITRAEIIAYGDSIMMPDGKKLSEYITVNPTLSYYPK